MENVVSENKPATLTPRDIANFFICSTEEQDDTMTNLKVQKLLYYAQGYHLAIFGEPLFDEPILAWQHGPVVESLFNELKGFLDGAITECRYDPSKFSEEQLELLHEVQDVYGQFSAWKLRNLTHSEPPWKDTEPQGVISVESMTDFFRTQLC